MADPEVASQALINADVGQTDTADEAAQESLAYQRGVNLAADSADTTAVDKRTE